jgi:hypothetical protein
MNTMINSDMSSITVSDDGLKRCGLPPYNPENLQKWASEAEITAYLAKIENDSRFWSDVPAPSYRTTLTPVEFKMMLTAAERVAVKQAAEAGDLVLADFLELLNDPRLKSVILTHPDNIAAMNYLVSLSILTEARAATILQGMLE